MWLIAFVLALAFPGFGHALGGRSRLGVAVATALVAAHALTLLTPWVMFAIFAARFGMAIHGAIVVRARRGPLRWEPAFGVVGVCVGLWLVIQIYVVDSLKASSSSMAPTLQVHDRFMVDKLHEPRRGDVIAFWYPCEHNVQYAKRVVAVGGDSVEVRCDVVYVNGVAVPREPVGKTEYLDFDEASDSWMRRDARESREVLDGHHYRVYDSPYAHGESPRDFPLRHERPSCANTTTGESPPSRFGTGDPIIGMELDPSSCAPQMQYVVPQHGLFVLGDNRYNSNDSRVWGPVDEMAVIGTVTGIWWADSNNGSQIGRIE